MSKYRPGVAQGCALDKLAQAGGWVLLLAGGWGFAAADDAVAPTVSKLGICLGLKNTSRGHL